MIDAQGLFRSGLCAWFAGNGKNVYGFSDAREGATLFYDHKISVPKETVHAVEKNLCLLGGITGNVVAYDAPEFTADPEGVKEIDELLGPDDGRPLISVAVGSRWPSKNWPPAFFAAVIDRVIEASSARVALIGSPDETNIGQKLLSTLSPAGTVTNLIGKTSLLGMVEAIRRSSVLMTNDSGPMHIAAAMSIPTVTWFGPTAPEKTGPYGSIHTIFKSDLECSPCFNRTCPLREQTCLTETVSPADAADAIVNALDGGKT